MIQKKFFESKKVDGPIVHIFSSALTKMKAIVDTHSMEVGWYGLVSKSDDGKIYTITDVFYVPQESMSGAECTISSTGQAVAMDQLNQAGIEDHSGLRLWGHSHVNMAANPSKTDVDASFQIASDNEDYILRLIMNKIHSINLAIYSSKEDFIFEELQYKVIRDDNYGAQLEKIKSMVVAEEESGKIISNVIKFLNNDFVYQEMVELIKSKADAYLPKDVVWDEVTKTVVSSSQGRTTISSIYGGNMYGEGGGVQNELFKTDNHIGSKRNKKQKD